MKATQQLKEEHQGVLLGLKILEKIAQKLKKGERVDPDHLKQLLEFLTVFVDKCHHSKEEELLFPALEKVGLPKEGGPVGVMLLEHNAGRGCIKGIKEAVSLYEQGEKSAALKFVSNAENYIALLREHIDKEDNILYQIADMHLDEKAQDQLIKEFEKIETERIGVGKHEQFHQMLNDLGKIYQI
ncbi:MAG: hemerythrin domain-containing protein [bacterium]|nr:hemerythrin domain-containing protein [bacterium]